MWKILDKDKHPYNIAILLFAFFSFVIGIVLFLKPTMIQVLSSDRRPHLIVESEPIMTVRFGVNILSSPDFLFRDTTIVDTNQPPIFLKPNSELMKGKLRVANGINVDSLFHTNKNISTDSVCIEFKLEFKVKNNGDKTAKIKALAITDTPINQPILRTNLEKLLLTPEVIAGEDDFKDILKDSTRLITTEFYLNGNPDEDQNIIVHVLLIYYDENDNFYDMYYWGKFKVKPLTVGIYNEPLYKAAPQGGYYHYMNVIHFYPRKPLARELFEPIKSRYDFEYRYPEEDILKIKRKKL